MSITRQTLAISGLPGMGFTHPDVDKAKKAKAAKQAKQAHQATARAQGWIRTEVGHQLETALELLIVPTEPGPRGLRGRAGNDGEPGPRGPKGDKGDRGERGANGRAGRDGSGWHEGTAAPKDAKHGDWWFNPDGTIKRLNGRKWLQVTTLRGRRGPVGPTGPAGRDGNRFLYGFGPPVGGQGGDAWFDLEIGDVWNKQRGGWVRLFNVGARAYSGEGAPTENPHDADDILEGDEPSSEDDSEFDSEDDSEFDSDRESESDSEFG